MSAAKDDFALGTSVGSFEAMSDPVEEQIEPNQRGVLDQLGWVRDDLFAALAAAVTGTEYDEFWLDDGANQPACVDFENYKEERNEPKDTSGEREAR